MPELKAEFCHFRDMEPEEFEYVKACASRWLSRLDGEPHKPVAVGDERLMMQLVKSFYTQLLDTCTLVIPEYSEDAYNS